MPPREFADYYWKDALRIGAGVVMLLLGLIGLVLPVLQGLLFLVAAFFLLAPYSRTVRRGLAWLRLKFPGAFARARGIKTRYFPRRAASGRER